MLSLTVPQISAIFDTLYDRPMTPITPWLEDEQSMLECIQLVTEVQTQLLVGGFTNVVRLKLTRLFGYLPDDVITGGTGAWQTL